MSSILGSLAAAGKAFEENKSGSREALIDNARALVGELEIPSEFLQRSFWAEVSLMKADTRYAIPANHDDSPLCPPLFVLPSISSSSNSSGSPVMPVSARRACPR